MVNYQKGKIYKIVSEKTNEVYIGSTCIKYLSARISGHRAAISVGKVNISSNKIISQGDAKIVLIEHFPCMSKKELHEREKYYILNTPNCINARVPARTQKEYRLQNKEILKQKRKVRNDMNKDKIKKHNKEYYSKNRDKLIKKIQSSRRQKFLTNIRKDLEDDNLSLQKDIEFLNKISNKKIN